MTQATDPMLEIMKQAMIAEIGKNLNFEHKLVQEVVAAVLNSKVDSLGRPTDKSYEVKSSFIEWLVKDCIRNVAIAAAQEWVKDNTEKMGEEIKKALDENRIKFIGAAAESMVNAMKTNLSCYVSLEFAKAKETEE